MRSRYRALGRFGIALLRVGSDGLSMQGTRLSYWVSVDQGVKEALSNGRVGTPVFVRWTLLAAGEMESVEGSLCRMAEQVISWFESGPERVYALKTDRSGFLSAGLEFASGQTALLTAGLSQGRPSVDFIMLGSEGAAYKREDLLGADGGDFESEESETSRSMRSLLQESLTSGKTVCAG